MVTVSGHSFNIGPMGKLHVCFKLADWFQRRRLLNNFPIGPMLKLCPLTVTILNRDRGHWTQFWQLTTFKFVSGDHDLHPRWLPWADIVLTYIVEPYGIWIVKLRCIRHADILKRAYLCQVSGTGSPEPLVCNLQSRAGTHDILVIN
jgi:hypothetical protein